MPHPERAFYAALDHEWMRASREGGQERGGDGKMIFEAVLDYLRSR
jgi:phosphoribosylformylglycinamidine (FGAM) synthase-like amidotransferase family enzyme